MDNSRPQQQTRPERHFLGGRSLDPDISTTLRW